MKVTNLILNILSSLNMLLGAAFPLMVSLFAFGFLGLLELGGVDGDTSVLQYSFIYSIVLLVLCILAIGFLILSIVTFVNRKKITNKKYTVRQIVSNAVVVLSFIGMLILLVLLVNYMSWEHDDNLPILFVFPIAGLITGAASIVVAVIDGIVHRNSKQTAS